jgi:hypothetical protein
MQSNDYIPGKGFRDGWTDRLMGRASRFFESALNNADPYWSEYNHGYTEANTKILEDAKKRQMNESRTFLSENSNPDF